MPLPSVAGRAIPKALLGLLQQNVGGYESAFGEIKLDPRMGPQGPVH